MAPFAAAAAAAVVFQQILRAAGIEYCLTQLTMSCYYAMVVLGLCLLMGHAGQVSLGHGAFFAIGGYTTAFLTTADCSAWASGLPGRALVKARVLAECQDLYGNPAVCVSPAAAFAAGLVLTGVVACVVGYPALRLKGHYLAMATLGFGLIVNKIAMGTAALGASDGIHGVPPWPLFPGFAISGARAFRVGNYYLAAMLLLALLLLLRNLVDSRVGRALQAIHDRETAANALGIPTASYRLRVFVLSALIAATAGALFTHYTGGIGPSEAGAIKSVRYVALAAAGGMASLWGVTAASLLLNYLSLRGTFGSFDNAVFGSLLITIVALAPDGPLQSFQGWIARLRRKHGWKSGESKP